jgi:glycogen synthase
MKTSMPKQIAFIAYETPYAPCGGVAAVMAHLPANLATTSGLPTIVITPFHSNISRTNSLEHEMQWLGDCEVPYGASSIIVDILRHHRDVNYIFLRAKDEPKGSQPFFSGIQHPYDMETSQNDDGSTLQRDALFFGAAVSRALPVIDQSASWILLLQDWEAATVALALKGAPTNLSYSLLLTLHNSYDKGANDEDLKLVGINPEACQGDTVLKRALPLVQTPVITVSDQFALDFTEEILLARIMAPHLASQLSTRLVGINNGPFTELSVDSHILAYARQGNFKPLSEWKTAFREKALILLEGFTPTKEKPIWGNLDLFNRNDAPWFIMAGRDDSRQKGYDVACTQFVAS